ncbi:uncharacterized protein LOC111134296 isoform X2 [Crassostrea virginica]
MEKKCVHKFLMYFSVFLPGMIEATTGCCGFNDNNVTCIKCCNNYHMVENTCKECTVGSWGDNCTNVCPYPFFGDGCTNKCGCNKTMCNKEKGCLNLAENVTSEQKTSEQKTYHSSIPFSKKMFIAIGAAVGMSLLALVLLFILLHRKRGVDVLSYIDNHTLQILRHQVNLRGISGRMNSLGKFLRTDK